MTEPQNDSTPVVSPASDSGGLVVRRLPVQFYGDVRHVVNLPIVPAGHRVLSLLERVGRLPEEQVASVLEETMASFGARHENLEETFEARCRDAASLVDWRADWTPARRRLAGAYLTMEYAIEGAALFNPSIVAHPDQSGVPSGAVRFLMSLRAAGEGHVSSIVFRTGIIDAAGEVAVDRPPANLARARILPDQQYLKPLVMRKLHEMGINSTEGVDRVLSRVAESFTLRQLIQAVTETRKTDTLPPDAHLGIDFLMWVVRSNYRIRIPAQADLTQLVLYPAMQEEAHGVEDLRLVRFVEQDGSVEYVGTYVAYDGQRTLPMLMRTKDFREIEVHSINGAAALDKGMALFPRRIHGHYVMCARIDGENLYIMRSDLLHFWESAERLAGPEAPWDLLQVGNCGSPIETPEGWLLLTHGVGPMRTYAIGAMLLDLEDPVKIRGRLRVPLLRAAPAEREGYVPNVVYTCGAMVHGGTLYIPFALADRETTICTVAVEELVRRLLDS